jgi:FtsP/CotA-like multicopper oxidase with cupredoxin domain
MSCDLDYTFSIVNHWMTVIEADGENTIPHFVDSLKLFAGQRYSVVVIADQPVGSERILLVEIPALMEGTAWPFSGTQVPQTPILRWYQQASCL